MSAKDDLYRQISACYHHESEGFTTQDCERFTSASRSVISLYLNQLCDEGYLRKENTRPVRFWLSEPRPTAAPQRPEQDVFRALIGATGSLKSALELCLAAVNYPDGGLPILVTGASGVGKSYLATLLHRYAGENGVIPRSARLVELNCADYANNPELLSSTLFGYVKGAFTGAEKEKTGLLDEADGGFFFLDEVHRLSAENQEKLFLFMDKGYFYRLGDNRQPCHARVRFLFATTENSENVLLTTFRRRIPVMVELPSSESRPFSEKLALVSTFFQAEAQRFKQDIHVTTDLIRHLITSPGRGNIGELKNRIKVLCASAYTQGQKNGIRLVGNPPAQDDSENVIFHWDENAFPALPLTPTRSVAGETLLENFCRSANVPLFVRKLEEHYHATLGEAAAARLYQGVLWKTTVDTLREFTELSGLRLGEMMEKAVFHCLQWCLHGTVSSAAIEHLTAVTEYIPQRACLLASETVSLLQRRLPETPAPLLHPLLSAVFCHQVEQEPLIQGIIVAHGLTTASSIAGTANNLLGGFYLKAFDMPLSVDTRGIISHLTTWIDGLKEQAGMVILVDMGSLEDIYAEIKLHIQGDLLVMNNVSTAMALDIAEKIQQRLSMKEIVDGIKGAWEIEARYYSGIVQGNKLIISCISGEGVSKQLQEIARRYVNDETLDVVTMEYDDLKWKLAKADSALYGTRLIITTTELNANAIPIINVRKLIGDKPDQLWKNYFSTIMSADRLKQMVDEIVILFTIEGVASHLSFLNPNVIIEEVEEVVKFYEMTYNIHFESYLRINLFMHLAAMIERLMTHEGLNHREDSELTDQQRNFIALTPQGFRPLIAKYRFAMTTTECLMIYELMEPWITVDHSLLVLNAQRDSVQVSGDA